MTSGLRAYDPPTTRNLVHTFDLAVAECQTIADGVDEASANLARYYRGDASIRYRNSMAEWLSGLFRVRNALLLLGESMQGYRKISENTESSNQETAHGWGSGWGAPDGTVPLQPTTLIRPVRVATVGPDGQPLTPLEPTRTSIFFRE